MSIEPLCMSRVTFSMIMGTFTISRVVSLSWELVKMSIEPLCMSRENFSMILGTFNISYEH
jgi:hypothetical protein